MTDKISIAWRSAPMSGAFHFNEATPGQSIAQILNPLRDLPAGFADKGEARLNGDLMPRAWWPHVKPKPGTGLTLHVPIRDGGANRQTNKNTIALVATIAVLLAAAAVSGGAAGGLIGGGLLAGGSVSASVAAAGIGVGGALNLAALREPA